MRLNLIQLQRDFKKYRKISKTLAFRLLVLVELAKGLNKFPSSKFGSVYLLITTQNNISVRTLERWVKAYSSTGPLGLLPKKRKGKKLKRIHHKAAELIRQYRELYNWGPETIQAHLAFDHGIELSRFKINQFLKERGYIKIRKRKKLKNKHTKLVVVEHPGVHTQTDVKHLPKILPNKTYVYNFVDHASRWEFKMAFDSYNPFNTKRFFQEVIRVAPFKIRSSQTDNGIEFTFRWITLAGKDSKNDFEEFLASEKINHRLIPPGEKELNGLVERSHRADDEELYHRIKPKDLKEFNKLLSEHCKWRNSGRRKKALGWLTTEDWLINYELHAEQKEDSQNASLSAA